MSALDHIDPELIEIVARLRRDPDSFLFQGASGAHTVDQLRSPVRPTSPSRATRVAEHHLLAVHRDELAVWLLRGASVAFRRDPVFSKVYIVEDDSKDRRPWDAEEFRRGALLAMEDIGRTLPHELDQELGALRVLMGGSTELSAILEACVLAERLRPFPSGAYLLGQALILDGQARAARALLSQRLRSPLDDSAADGLLAMSGSAALISGDAREALSAYRALAERTRRTSFTTSALYCAISVDAESVAIELALALAAKGRDSAGVIADTVGSFAAVSSRIGACNDHGLRVKQFEKLLREQGGALIGGGDDEAS